MFTKRRIVLLAIIAVCWGLSGWGIGVLVSDYVETKDIVLSQTYEGRLYLDEQGYSQFKQFLAQHADDVYIQKLDVYSSPDPLVDFSLVAKGDSGVQYGTLTATQYGSYAGTWTHVALAVLFGVLLAPVVVLVLGSSWK